MIEFFTANAGWLFAVSAAMFVGTLVVIPWLVIRMSPEYFLRKSPPEESWRGQHPVIRWTLRGAKNALGVFFVLAGIVLSVPLVPGQGLLTLLVGVSLLDFPGKRRLELSIVRQRHVRHGIDWIRRRAGRPPLVVPDAEDDGTVIKS